MHLAEFLRNAIEKLKHAGVDNPQLDARLLAGQALGLGRAGILSQSGRVLSDKEKGEIEELLARRAAGESVGRILGKREFWGLDFGLNEATLEPRPDSETLVEAVLNLMPRRRAAPDSRFRGNDEVRILDLGMGTGCLLLALLHEMPDAMGVGVDINSRAIEQAANNAETLGIGERAEFRVGNWLSGISEKFDIIISNPPYIASAEIPTLMREVREHDPLPALDGGKDGLDVYRLLIPQLAGILNPQGLVAFEVGDGQAKTVAEFLRQNGFTDVATHKDLGGIERCVTGSKAVS